MSKKDEFSLNQEKRNEIPSMWEKAKCALSLKNLKFIIPRGIQGSSKREFIKKGKDSSSCASTSRQEGCRESASKWLKLRKTKEAKDSQKVHLIKRWKTTKKKKKPARLKTQKGGLDKS